MLTENCYFVCCFLSHLLLALAIYCCWEASFKNYDVNAMCLYKYIPL